MADLNEFELNNLALAIHNKNDFENVIDLEEDPLVKKLTGIQEFMNLVERENNGLIEKKKIKFPIRVSNINRNNKNDIIILNMRIKQLNNLLEKTEKEIVDTDTKKNKIQILLEQYINLMNLYKTTDDYINFKTDIINDYPRYDHRQAQNLLKQHGYKVIIETYERENVPLKEAFKKKYKKEIEEIEEEELARKARNARKAQDAQEESNFSIFSFRKRGGRRSTRKRKKTIRKKRKNKKRTRRFR